MEETIQQRNLVLKKIDKKTKALNELKYQLIDLDRQLEQFNSKEIIETMDLNDQQELIIKDETKNILVVACPGSGKTHTLISRYIYLVTEKNVNPNEIILITFTKKAGMEMHERLYSKIPSKLPFYVGSIHGLSYKLLNNNHIVLDESDSKSLLKSIVNDIIKNIDDNEIINKNISSIVDTMASDYPINLKRTLRKFNMISYEDDIKNIIKEYNNIKKTQNLLDFNDLMTNLVKFLKTKKGEEFKKNVKHIFFDEYQDINPIQNYILSLFNNTNIVAVGDDAQAIYRFRGSSVKYIWDFENKFNPNKIYYLEKNYRSTQSIINLCQNIIKNNKNQFNKNVTTDNKIGNKPTIISFNDQYNHEQYNFIVNDIIKKKNKGINLNEIVILARNNYILNNIEPYLLSKNISVTKNIGLALLDKEHIKDFIAFIIILYHNNTSIHWKRILSLHPNIKLKNSDQIINYNDNIRFSINDLKDSDVNYSQDLINLNELLNNIDNTDKSLDKIKMVITYLEDLWKLNKVNDLHKRSNDIKLLLNYLNSDNLMDFVNNLYTNIDIETNYNESVLLSTIHGAKGLEWKYVYIIDVNNYIFPNIKPKYYSDELEEMEEERRLFYVAASRAKKELVITYNCKENSFRNESLSPLIKELDGNLYRCNDLYLLNYEIKNNIAGDIGLYLRLNGTRDVRDILFNLDVSNNNLVKGLVLSNEINKMRKKNVLNKFITLIIYKIIQKRYPDNIKSFELEDKNKAYYVYIDKYNDWQDNLDSIFYLSSLNTNDKEKDIWKSYLLSDEFIKHMKLIEMLLNNYIKKLGKVTRIELNKLYMYDNKNIFVDVLIDDTMITLNTFNFQTTTINNVCENLLKIYLLNKNNIEIKKLILFNPILGDIDEININTDLKELYNIFYN